MGKCYYNLYDQIHHPLNLWNAYQAARRGKRYQTAVATFEYEREQNLLAVERELRDETYQPGEYYNFYIHEPKRRLISAAPFRDRVVHHALMNIIEPLFERQFIFDSYANRVGKGTHKALDRCTYFLRRHRYVMHCDVQKFFPMIDHQLLSAILARTIGDKAVLVLIEKILASGWGIQTDECRKDYFPGDDLFAVQRPRGLAIGNLTSQHWGNVYLNELDQFAKRTLKCRAYIRYVDDILLFANDKSTLHTWREAIIQFLRSLRLRLHETHAQPRPSETGIPFLGFIVYPDYRRLKRRSGFAYQRHLKRLAKGGLNGEIPSKQVQASVSGWINHASYGDTWGLRRAILASANLDAEN